MNMPEGWLRVNVMIAVLVAVFAVSLASLAVMMSSGEDYDTMMAGPEICWLPLSIAAIVLSLAMLSTYIPYRGTGKRQFEVGLEDMVSRVEMYLESRGIRYEKDVRVDQVRRTLDHWDRYTFSLEGKDASILVRGREEGEGTLVLVAPWPAGDPAFVDGLERAILL